MSLVIHIIYSYLDNFIKNSKANRLRKPHQASKGAKKRQVSAHDLEIKVTTRSWIDALASIDAY